MSLNKPLHQSEQTRGAGSRQSAPAGKSTPAARKSPYRPYWLPWLYPITTREEKNLVNGVINFTAVMWYRLHEFCLPPEPDRCTCDWTQTKAGGWIRSWRCWRNNHPVTSEGPTNTKRKTLLQCQLKGKRTISVTHFECSFGLLDPFAFHGTGAIDQKNQFDLLFSSF